MEALLGRLARYARPLLLIVPGLLTIGASLLLLALPILGWSLYGLGLLGLLLALPAVAATYRTTLDRLSWVALGLFYIGVVLGVPVALLMLNHHVQNPTLNELVMPRDVTLLALLPGLLAWVGLAVFGLAAWSSRAVPRGGAVLLVVGAVLAFAAEIGFLVPVMWAFGVIVASIGLVWLAPPEERVRAVPAARAR
jgi:hypothetical protein